MNVQFASTCNEQAIIGMDVVNVGSDMAQLTPMVEQVEQRLGQAPRQWLTDGGFAAHGQLDAVAGKTEVYAPVPESRAKKGEQGESEPADKYQPKPGDSPAVREWRKRMQGPEAKVIYKQRAATAELVNAQARNRGMLQMPVRGLLKVRSVVAHLGLDADASPAQCTASCPAADSHPTASSGLPASRASSCLCGCCRGCSGGASWKNCCGCTTAASSSFR